MIFNCVDIHRIGDDTDFGFGPSDQPVHFRDRTRRSGQNPHVLLKPPIIPRVHAARRAQPFAEFAVAALHRGSRTQQVVIVQGVNQRGSPSSRLAPHQRREAVDIMRIDHVRPYALQRLPQRAERCGIPKVNRVPRRACQAARTLFFLTEAPVQVPRSDSPDANTLPEILFRLFAGRNHLDVMAELLDRQRQLGGHLFRPSDGVRREER